MTAAEAVDALVEARIDVAGRLRPIAGVDGITLLDDSYNASPASTIAALDVLAETSGRHVAVLGDMLELGTFEAEGHRLVGRHAAGIVDYLVTVGTRAAEIAAEARASGVAEGAVDAVGTREEALAHLRMALRAGDTVLVKGSRAIGLDEIVAALRETSTKPAEPRES